jgi:AcrR family transcriptional regulator
VTRAAKKIDGRTSRAEDVRERRRAQMLETALRVFGTKGFHQTSISDLVEAAGVARGTFYLYFESKSAVFSSILDQAMTELRARLHRIEVEDPSAPPPQVQLRTQVVATLEYILQDRPLAMLLLFAGHTPDAEAAERLDQFFGEVRDLLRRAFESGTEIKLLRKVNSELAAAAMLGMIRGVVEQLISQPTPPQIETVVDELLIMALRGVLA